MHRAISEQERCLEDEWYQKNPDCQPKNSFISYGVCTELHGDIEYLYEVNLGTGKIEVKHLR